MRMRKEQDGRPTCRRCGGAWFLVVFRLVLLQAAFTPVAHSTTELPPLLEEVSSASVPNTTRLLASIYTPSVDEGGGSLNLSVTTTVPGVSAEFNSASPGTVETISTSANAFASTTECLNNCTKTQFSELGTTTLTEYMETSEEQSEISTQTEQSTVTLGGFNSTKQPDSVGQTTTPLTSQSFPSTSTPKTSTLISTSIAPQVTDGSTSVVDTSMIVESTFSSQPSTPATNSPSPTLSVSPVITPPVTFPSNIQTTKPVTKSTSSSTTSEVSTSSTSAEFIATTGSALTTQQWVGIGIAIAAALVLLGVALIFLTWLRARHNLSKKPIITVSKMEYAQSNTLEKKTDPQWRKSLTMALQSMNTHIEVPTETDEEMQAVDNAAFDKDSTDPKTSNQDALHLTKV